MPTWLETIKNEVGKLGIDDLIEPTTKISAQDHEVAELDEELRKLYSYAQLLEKQLMKESVKARFNKNEEQRESHNEEASILGVRHRTITDIFWISLRDRFDLWEKPIIGVRREWKVVWINSDSFSFFARTEDILRTEGMGEDL